MSDDGEFCIHHGTWHCTSRHDGCESPGAIPAAPMPDDDTICAACRRPIPACTCNRRRPS
jgi:hypothetical protein